MKSIAIATGFVLALLGTVVDAHTLVRAVYINGVDQGTFKAIRPPAFNGAPNAGTSPFGQGSGYQNSPVRDLTSQDMKCNVLGDLPAPDTLKVTPGDVVSFEWGHESRQSGDGVIESSHKGAVLVYISPNPPTANSWVKIFEEGEYAPNQWAVVPKLTGNKGVHSVKLPAGLKPGQYLLRPELITLHEAEVAHTANANRGVQLYMECIQIEITGSGTVSLPQGVSFPGAYAYSDPGLVYNLYYTQVGAPAYKIPGPTVWAGAAPSVANPPLVGGKVGPLTVSRWSTWVGSDRVVTKVGDNGATTKSPYVPSWPSTYVPPPVVTAGPTSDAPISTTSAVVITTSSPPIITSAPIITSTSTTSSIRTTSTAQSGGTVQQWGQCGGINYRGPTTCVSPFNCKKINDYYFQCLA